MKHGFVKVAAAAPEIKVADPQYNAQQIIETMRKSDELGVKLLVLPALSLTGTTCGDLFYQNTLLQGAAAALRQIVTASIDMGMLTFVGLPVAKDGKVYNCAAAVYGGDLLGVVPMSCAGDKHFSVPEDDAVREVKIGDLYAVACGTRLLFECEALPGLKVAAQVAGDVGAPVPPAADHALAGATVIAQLSAFSMTVDSTERETSAVREQSARLHCGFVMAAPGSGESTTDHAYSGLCVVAENGCVLTSAETGCSTAVTELDVEALEAARRKAKNFRGKATTHMTVKWGALTWGACWRIRPSRAGSPSTPTVRRMKASITPRLSVC